MTYRTIVGYGLIAGLGFREMQHLTPGFVTDLFLARQSYDDIQHGIQRGK